MKCREGGIVNEGERPTTLEAAGPPSGKNRRKGRFSPIFNSGSDSEISKPIPSGGKKRPRRAFLERFLVYERQPRTTTATGITLNYYMRGLGPASAKLVAVD